jgi:hypothetical protein
MDNYTQSDGKKGAIDITQEKKLSVITPTHFMWIREDGKTNKFIAAAGGTYQKQGDKVIPKIEVATWDHSQPTKTEMTYKVAGDKLVIQGVDLTNNNKWTETHQRVGAKTASMK